MPVLPTNQLSDNEKIFPSEQLLERGLVFHQNGQLDQAIEIYQNLLVQSPDHAAERRGAAPEPPGRFLAK